MMEKSCAERVRDNLKRVEASIADACRRAGRAREEVTLMAVTKTVEPDIVQVAIDAGVSCIGENRVQEALRKREQLQLRQTQLHLIGHLQTNKIRSIVGKVDMIQSVDSLRVAQGIDRESRLQSIVTDVLVEVNIGGEASKSGVSPEELEPLLEEISGFSGLHVCGLMTIPPIAQNPDENRRVFSRMYKLFIDIRDKNIDNIDMHRLSMGMSADYTEAILEGSTMVRVGSALFGQRNYN